MVTTHPAEKRSATCWDLSQQQKLQFARRPWSHNNTKCMGADVEKPQFSTVSSYFSSTHLTSGRRTSVWWRNEWTSLQAFAYSVDVFFYMCLYFLNRDRCHDTFIFPFLCESLTPSYSCLFSCFISAAFVCYWAQSVGPITLWRKKSHAEMLPAVLLHLCFSLSCVFKAYMLSISCHYVWSPESV